MNDIEAKKKKEIHLTELELLAPAKNLECGIAAIDHGADAVYIGLCPSVSCQGSRDGEYHHL